MANPPRASGISTGECRLRNKRFRCPAADSPARSCGPGLLWLLLAALGAGTSALDVRAQLPADPSGNAATEPITIVADSVRNWTRDSTRILLLRGNVYVAQGLTRVRADHAVVWIDERTAEQGRLTKLDVYAEGNVRVESPRQKLQPMRFFDSFETHSALRVEMKERLSGPDVDDPIYQRAETQRNDGPPVAEVQQTMFQTAPILPPLGTAPRRLRAFPRSSRPFQVHTFRVSDEEQAVVVTDGINFVIDNVQGIGTVDILADRMVLWTRTLDAARLSQEETAESQETPLELYLEGNVVMRQGAQTIECTQLYYDVSRNQAVANNAELEAFNEALATPVYFRARKLRQVAPNKFLAERAGVTPSRFAAPTYELKIESITVDGISEPGVDPATGEKGAVTRHQVIGENNILYFEDVPVFYWPTVEAELEELRTPLRRLAVRQSGTYGTELHTTWDMFQLLGRSAPSGTKWDLDLDYMSERGPAAGSQLEYRGDNLLGIDGRYYGLVDTYGIFDDQGKDRLGRGRKDIDPEEDNRGRFLWRHRHLLPYDFTLSLEFAWISDINFLEEFFEREWEEDKDQESLVHLKQQRENWAWSVLARGRVMDFVTTTEYLPQLDFHLVGEPLLGDLLSYFQHSSIGYLRLRDSDRSEGDIFASPFGDAGPTFTAGRGDTLHELDLPFNLGPIRVVPYAVGRLTGWTDTLLDDEGRVYGAVGTRASMPLWRVFPGVESDLWNVHGLAHKIVFGLDYFLADSDLDHTLLPQFDELEDDAEQVFRRRFLFRDFGVPPALAGPPGLDPRLYAIRTGLLTAPESVDDLQVLRMNVRQRLQTKRGVPGARHVIDWMTLETAAAWFPQEDRDNFGDDFGLFTYDYSWHLGDRTSILSSGWFETYQDGPRMWTIGSFIERPPRGSVYLGFGWLEPVDSRVVQFSYNYWMSPKWVSSFSTSYDFGETQNLGQSLVLTRIGADIVFRFGFTWNPLRDNFGIGFEIQPRVDPDLHLGSLRGAKVPLEFAPVE